MKKILFLATVGMLFAAGNADAKAVKLGSSDDGGARIAAAKEKRVKPVKCAKGQFKNSNGECVGCTVANCAECKTAGVCKKCKAGYALLSGGTCGCASNAVCGDKEICENKVCVGVSCPDGYYASEHKCKACSSNCLTCSDQNTCTSCETGKYLSGGSCNGCSAKFSHCLECDSTKCTKCDGETDKINGVCVEPGCKTSADCTGNRVCNASNECEECPDGYEKQGNSCVPSGSEDECSVDAECDENEKCENGGCVPDDGKGGEDNTCKTDCDCQWWEVCNGGKCQTATSCEGLDACKRSKGQGGNYKSSKSGNNCSSQYINVANMTCWVCQPDNESKKCAEINGSYKTSCGNDEKSTDTGVTGSDGKCYTCTAKTCAERSTTPTKWVNAGEACPSGYFIAGSVPGCTICAPNGGGQNCSCTSKTSGSVSNGSKICFYGSTPALNAKGCQNLSSSTMTLKCTYKGLSGVLSILTCTGCSPTVTCTHQYGGGTFTVTNVPYEPTLVCDGPNGCKQM